MVMKMKVNIKDLVVLGVIAGIAIFFIGAIVSNVFPSSETSLTSYRVAAIFKLLGIGFLTTTMIVGGIVNVGIDKNLKVLMLLLGLIILTTYTIGSQSLRWNVPITGMMASQSQSYGSRPTSYGMPGFELITVVFAVSFLLWWRYKKTKIV